MIVGIIGCEKRNTQATEKRIAEKIIKHIIQKDSLKNHTYSGEIYFHIKSEKLNDKNYKTLVSLNGLKSKFQSVANIILADKNVRSIYLMNQISPIIGRHMIIAMNPAQVDF